MSPQRPRAHELEEESRQALRRVLPSAWVVRPIEDDYGIDREVEIFQDGRATGLTFKVQLKASERAAAAGPTRTVQWDRLDYWNSLDVPVLIVYFVAASGRTYGRWAHAHDLDLQQRRGKRSTTIRFTDDDLLNAAAPQLLDDVAVVRQLRAGQVPLPVPVLLAAASGLAVPPAELRAGLRALIARLGLADVVALRASGPAVRVAVSRTTLRASLPVEYGSLSATLPPGHEDAAGRERLLRDILVAVGFVLLRAGAGGVAARVMAAAAGGSLLAAVHGVAALLGVCLTEQGRAKDALALAIPLLRSADAGLRDVGELYLYDALPGLSREELRGERELLPALRAHADLERGSGDPARAGRADNALAEVLYRADEFPEALQRLDAAAALHPEFLRDRLFRRRRAGVRWDLGLHDEAAEDYRVALELGGDPGELEPLLADSLMHAGRYGEALAVLRAFTPRGGHLDRLAALDLLALEELVRVTGLDRQDRQPASGEDLQDISCDTAVRLLRDRDALDPRLWLVLLSSKAEVDLAPALLIALVLVDSAAAWVSAAICAFAADVSADLLHHVVDSGARLGQPFLDAVEAEAQHQDAEEAAQLRQVAYERADLLHTARL